MSALLQLWKGQVVCAHCKALDASEHMHIAHMIMTSTVFLAKHKHACL